jgi:hypothetical protein
MLPNNTQNPKDVLQDIHSLMQRSTKFMSLSGLSAIASGIVGVVGALVCKSFVVKYMGRGFGGNEQDLLLKLFIVGLITFIVALALSILFCVRKAKQIGASYWDITVKRLLFYSAIPLLVGAVFCAAMVYYQIYLFIVPATLFFYGLALIQGSHYTIGTIKYLGFIQIILGSVNLFFPQYGFEFWITGFGIFNILYGVYMYLRYK